VIDFEEVPTSLVINWDHTAMKIACAIKPVDDGKERVEITGKEDKCQITAILLVLCQENF